MNYRRLCQCVALCCVVTPVAGVATPVSAASSASAEPEPAAINPDLLLFGAPRPLDRTQPTPRGRLPALEFNGLSGDAALPGAGPEEPETRQLLRADIEQYRQAVREQEASGAWEAALSQDLMGLGLSLQRMGDHEQAIRVFDRAAHVARVNRGLYTLDQVPALERRIASHLALGQWEEADRQQQYSFFLHSRALEQDDPAFVKALVHFADWNMRVHFRGIDESPQARLVDAYRLYGAAHNLLTEQAVGDGRTQLEYLDALAGVAYLVARAHIRDDAEVLRESRPFTDRSLDYPGREMSRYRINGFEQGERALRLSAEIQAERLALGEATAAEAAEAAARLGDWHLLFDRRQAAAEAYARAWELLASASGKDEADRYFDTVHVLPRFSGFAEQRRFAAQDQVYDSTRPGHIDLELDASRFGRVDDIEVIGAEPVNSEEVESRLTRSLRYVRMRPRVQSGETVDAESIRIRFPYWY